MATYPETIPDEATGLEVPNELYKAYQDGIKVGYSAGIIEGQYTNHKRHGKKMIQARQEGIREVVEWIEEFPSVYKPSPEAIQAKLKTWFKDNPELLKKWRIK